MVDAEGRLLKTRVAWLEEKMQFKNIFMSRYFFHLPFLSFSFPFSLLFKLEIPVDISLFYVFNLDIKGTILWTINAATIINFNLFSLVICTMAEII